MPQMELLGVRIFILQNLEPAVAIDQLFEGVQLEPKLLLPA